MTALATPAQSRAACRAWEHIIGKLGPIGMGVTPEKYAELMRGLDGAARHCAKLDAEQVKRRTSERAEMKLA